MHELYAPDAAEQLRRWDAGDAIWSIELGGIGPGYEQAIHVLAIEIVRDYLGKPLDPKDRTWADDTVRRIDKDCLGFSGAQVGQAKSLAYHWLTRGPKAVCEDPEAKDRTIQVSNKWPHVKTNGNAQPKL